VNTDTNQQYRWCIHCWADCWPAPEDQQHTLSCPTNTGVYPVQTADAGCTACHVRLQPGDVYVLTGSGFVVCLGCGAAAAPINDPHTR